MRILYIDVDSLRPDHLGCYGYHRNTSPNVDALAEEAVRFDNCYVSDAPCLPSRTALWSGRFGIHTGVVGHGGTAVQPFVEGESRGFNDLFGTTGWMHALRQAGYKTATISSFADRHSAWHWYAAYNEMHNVGMHGHERAHHVNDIALPWLERNGREDTWFLHVNYWDPHTPYRTPEGAGDPFAGQPLPAWLTEEMWQQSWEGYGPHSPQELHGFGEETNHQLYPRVPAQLDSYERVRQWIDGYDTGIRYMDDHLGQLLNQLADLGVLEDTAIIFSADHGENQGELNTWGDHQTADHWTCRVPLLIRWPGLTDTPRVDKGLHYHVDWAATLIEMVNGTVPDNWDGQSFAGSFRQGQESGRPYLVTSQQAWTCQRGVRFDDYLYIHTYHNGYKDLPPEMLFNLAEDPYQQQNLSQTHPQRVREAAEKLASWKEEMMASSRHDIDPMNTVLNEGGPFHVRGRLPAYLERLQATGRAHHAHTLASQHPDDAKGVSQS